MTSRRALFLAVLALLAIFSACDSGEDDFSLEGTNISMSEIAGTWTATRAFFSRAADGPAVEVEIIAQGGTATLVIQNNGRFTFTTMLPGEAAEVTTGQLGFDEDLLVVIYDDEPDDFEFVRHCAVVDNSGIVVEILKEIEPLPPIEMDLTIPFQLHHENPYDG